MLLTNDLSHHDLTQQQQQRGDREARKTSALAINKQNYHQVNNREGVLSEQIIEI